MRDLTVTLTNANWIRLTSDESSLMIIKRTSAPDALIVVYDAYFAPVVTSVDYMFI